MPDRRISKSWEQSLEPSRKLQPRKSSPEEFQARRRRRNTSVFLVSSCRKPAPPGHLRGHLVGVAAPRGFMGFSILAKSRATRPHIGEYCDLCRYPRKAASLLPEIPQTSAAATHSCTSRRREPWNQISRDVSILGGDVGGFRRTPYTAANRQAPLRSRRYR